MRENVRLCPPLLLDGGTGTEYAKRGMPLDSFGSAVWAYNHPEAVREVARSYAQAGSDIVYTPTLLANSPRLRESGDSSYAVDELNRALVRLTREGLEGTGARLAGCVSSTGMVCRPFGETEFTDLIKVCREQIYALAEAGVDLLVIETMQSLAACRAALLAARATGLPVWITVTVDQDGNMPCGDTLLPCLLTLQDMGLSGFGLNCGLTPEQMLPLFEQMLPYAKIPLIAKPAHRADSSAIKFAEGCARLMRHGVGILGGCCGTSPAEIHALHHRMGTIDFGQVRVRPANYDILACNRETVFYLDGDLEYSEPIPCMLDMADELLACTHDPCDAALVELVAPDDGLLFSLNAHMLALPVVFYSDSLEWLEGALLHYQGKALISSVDCVLERDQLETLAARYGATVL